MWETVLLLAILAAVFIISAWQESMLAAECCPDCGHPVVEHGFCCERLGCSCQWNREDQEFERDSQRAAWQPQTGEVQR